MKHEEDKEVQGLSIVARYTITAVVLAVVTAIEVLVLYPPLVRAGDTFKIALLAFLGIGKFILVVGLFMHLWNDDPIFTGIFGLGMVIGVGTLVALLAVMNVYPHRSDAVKAPPLRQIYEDREKVRRGEALPHTEQHSWRQWEALSA